jgi:hypothetical protein
VGEVLARVAVPGEEEGDLVARGGGDDARGVDAGPLLLPPRPGRLRRGRPGLGPRTAQGDDGHRGVVVVDGLALRRVADERGVGGREPLGGGADERPLRRHRQRDAEVALRALETNPASAQPVERSF